MISELIFLNGRLCPASAAVMPLSCIEYQYGFGVYETLRARENRVLFAGAHAQRLLVSASAIGLEHDFSPAQIVAHIRELAAQISAPAFNLKMLLIGGASPGAAQFFIIPLAPLFPDKKLYRDGAAAITYRYERLLPKAKTLNMLGSFLAYRQARLMGGYDALLVDRHGYITEGTRTNFFAVKNKTIYEAPSEKILDGVTRDNLLRVARANGFTLAVADIAPSDLPNYDGAFLTSTSSKIMPLKKIDAFEFSKIAPAITELMTAFDRFLNTQEERGVIF